MDNRHNDTNINWFPGHMAKAIRQMEEDLKLVDVVIELLDARIPISSQNPDLNGIMSKSSKTKKKIVILNKSDLADKKEKENWVKYFKNEGITAIVTDANSGVGISECVRQIEREMQEEIAEQNAKGRIGRKIRAMIVGIPNVGKSSFINRIAKKASAEVGNKPGVTKAKQWIRINESIELLDTPGILWPKFDNQEIALNLSYIGTIKDDILDKVEISYKLLEYLLKNYKQNVCERYKIDKNEIDSILNRNGEYSGESYNNVYDIMLMIGKKRGALISGGNIDEEKTARLILDDFRTGKLGKITLEKVDYK